LSESLGAGYLRLFAPAYRGGSVARELRRTRAGLDAVVDMAAAQSIVVLVETAPDTLAPTPELAASLVAHHSPKRAGVLYDPGNTVIEGYVEPALAAACLGPHLHHVHVKNIGWVRNRGSWRWCYLALGGGLLDWGGVLAALDAAGYAGGFSIDHLRGRPTLAALRAETELLCKLVDEVLRPEAKQSTPKGAMPSPASV
jgi:sugar phosphate isomerase/epimerase